MIENNTTPPPAGYHGAYLHVDVSSGTAKRVEIPADILRQFLGGTGLGTWLMLSLDAPSQDPLSPEAPLAFVFSPLVGSPLTTSAKFAVVSRSPLTGRLNDSLASSAFALAGKRTGHDAIVVSGRASEPSILVIDEQQVQLQPAGELWGMTIEETERYLKEHQPAGSKAAVIGPAGENLVHYATLSHDGRHAGRGGSGAVLGAKNIKAVIVRGSKRCRWEHPEQLVELARDLSDRSLGPATAKYRELGTAANLVLFNRLHALPTRNFQQGHLEGVEELSPQSLSMEREKVQSSCAACTIGCTHIYGIRREGEEAGAVRVEYESLFALGPLCGVTDQEFVLTAMQRCDQLGIDTISTGGTIAFAMECVERDLLDAPWLRFGDGQAVLDAIELIGKRHELGDLLAGGSRSMAEHIGKGTIDFAPQVKGLEIPGYEPRALQTMALGFAVGSRGADHNRSGAYEVDFSEQVDRRQGSPAAAEGAIATEDRATIMDSLILCKFLRGALDDFYGETAAMLASVTGWDVDGEELQQVARRVAAARKLFNIRSGWTPAEDSLPARFLSTPLPDDPQASLTAERLQEMIRAYNLGRGWEDNGFLSAAVLEQYGLAQLSSETPSG
jgi:aldehyde:ferredoxin oxidoreductase